MAPFARIDSQIRANFLILANRFRVPELNPFFCESHFGGQKIANRRFEAIRANRSNVMKMGGFSANFDSRESPRFALRIARPSKFRNFFWKVPAVLGYGQTFKKYPDMLFWDL